MNATPRYCRKLNEPNAVNVMNANMEKRLGLDLVECDGKGTPLHELRHQAMPPPAPASPPVTAPPVAPDLEAEIAGEIQTVTSMVAAPPPPLMIRHSAPAETPEQKTVRLAEEERHREEVAKRVMAAGMTEAEKNTEAVTVSAAAPDQPPAIKAPASEPVTAASATAATVPTVDVPPLWKLRTMTKAKVAEIARSLGMNPNDEMTKTSLIDAVNLARHG